jgi:hypothetical protein
LTSSVALRSDPAVGRKTTGLDIAELARRAPAVLDVIDGPIVSSLAKRLVIGPEDYDYDYYMGDPRCVSFGALIYPPDADAAGYTCTSSWLDTRCFSVQHACSCDAFAWSSLHDCVIISRMWLADNVNVNATLRSAADWHRDTPPTDRWPHPRCETRIIFCAIV